MGSLRERAPAAMIMEEDREVHQPTQAGLSRTLVFSGVLILVAAALLSGFWKWQGSPGLLGSAIGLAIGGTISAVGYLLRKRALGVSGPKVVTRMMTQVVATFGLFIASAIVLALLWKEMAPAVLLTALGIYLTVSFYTAFFAKTEQT